MGIEFFILTPRNPKPVEASDGETTFPHASIEATRGSETTSEPSSPEDGDTVMIFNWRSWRPIEQEMIDLGMVAGVDPEPEPDLTAFGWDGPCGYEVLQDPSLPAAASDAIWDWLEQEPAALGIPAFKLGNGYWIVTPTEIRSALAQLEVKPMPDIPGWDAWIAFLRRAADAGGMQVW